MNTFKVFIKRKYLLGCRKILRSSVVKSTFILYLMYLFSCFLSCLCVKLRNVFLASWPQSYFKSWNKTKVQKNCNNLLFRLLLTFFFISSYFKRMANISIWCTFSIEPWETIHSKDSTIYQGWNVSSIKVSRFGISGE